MQRKTYKSKTNTGYKGIYLHKATGKFEVKVAVTSKTRKETFYVGTFPTMPAAMVGRTNFITNLI